MRALLSVVSLALLAGCAVRPVGSLASTSAPPTAPPSLTVGSDGSPVGTLLAEVFAQALIAANHPARVAGVPADAADAAPLVTTGTVSVVPVFAGSALRQLGGGEAESDETVVEELAAALDGEAAVLRASRVSAEPVFVLPATLAAAKRVAGLGDLVRLGPTVAVLAPGGWSGTPEGVAGLRQVYRVAAAPREVAEAARRRQLLAADDAPVAVFWAHELGAGDPGLTVLEDPLRLVPENPQVVLIEPQLAEDEAVVRVLSSVQAALTNEHVAAISGRVTVVGLTAAVAEWLAAEQLA